MSGIQFDRFDGTLNLAIYVLECSNQFPALILRLRRLDLGTGDPADADAADVLHGHAFTHHQVGQNNDFGGGVKAVHIAGGICFRVTFSLGILQSICIVRAVLHLAKNIVGCAVKNTLNASDTGCG